MTVVRYLRQVFAGPELADYGRAVRRARRLLDGPDADECTFAYCPFPSTRGVEPCVVMYGHNGGGTVLPASLVAGRTHGDGAWPFGAGTEAKSVWPFDYMLDGWRVGDRPELDASDRSWLAGEACRLVAGMVAADGVDPWSGDGMQMTYLLHSEWFSAGFATLIASYALNHGWKETGGLRVGRPGMDRLGRLMGIIAPWSGPNVRRVFDVWPRRKLNELIGLHLDLERAGVPDTYLRRAVFLYADATSVERDGKLSRMAGSLADGGRGADDDVMYLMLAEAYRDAVMLAAKASSADVEPFELSLEDAFDAVGLSSADLGYLDGRMAGASITRVLV